MQICWDFNTSGSLERKWLKPSPEVVCIDVYQVLGVTDKLTRKKGNFKQR